MKGFHMSTLPQLQVTQKFPCHTDMVPLAN